MVKRKFFNILIIATTMLAFLITVAKADNFNYKQRPAAVQKKIDELFNKLAETPVSSWGGTNGLSKYGICGIDEEKLILDIITNNPKQTDFYFLDVGAGQFQWVDNVVQFLNSKPNITTNKKFHVIGVSGEGKNNPKGRDEVTKNGNCISYKLGGFKIENIIEAFEERGMYLDGKIDLTVSQWTLRHLVDSLGTFLQIHQLAKLNGYILLEGLYFDRLDAAGNHVYDSLDQKEGNLNPEHLLRDLKQVYLMCPNNRSVGRGSRDIMIKKSNIDANTKHNLSYLGLRDRGPAAKNACQFITQFLYTDAIRLQTQDEFYELYCFRGHNELYDMIKEKELFSDESKEYGDREFFSVSIRAKI